MTNLLDTTGFASTRSLVAMDISVLRGRTGALRVSGPQLPAGLDGWFWFTQSLSSLPHESMGDQICRGCVPCSRPVHKFRVLYECLCGKAASLHVGNLVWGTVSVWTTCGVAFKYYWASWHDRMASSQRCEGTDLQRRFAPLRGIVRQTSGAVRPIRWDRLEYRPCHRQSFLGDLVLVPSFSSGPPTAPNWR